MSTSPMSCPNQGSGVFRECPYMSLIQAVEAEGFGGGGVVRSAFGDVQVVRRL